MERRTLILEILNDEKNESTINENIVIYNKTPAQAFTPPADEKKMGTIWIFGYYGSGRGRCRYFFALKWGRVLISKN